MAVIASEQCSTCDDHLKSVLRQETPSNADMNPTVTQQC